MSYVTRNVPADHPDFGRAFLCPTCQGGPAVESARQRKRARVLQLLHDAGLTESARHDFLTWGDFSPARLGAEYHPREVAIKLAEQWSRAELIDYAVMGKNHPFNEMFQTAMPFRPASSMWLYGPFGTGKTGLARLAYRTRLETTGEVGIFVEWQAFYEAIKGQYGRYGSENQSYPLLDAVASIGLLVLDDVGRLRKDGPVSDDQYEKFAYVIDSRYKRELPTIITSNLDRTQMRERFDSYIVGRLAEMCVIAPVAGGNFREWEQTR